MPNPTNPDETSVDDPGIEVDAPDTGIDDADANPAADSETTAEQSEPSDDKASAPAGDGDDMPDWVKKQLNKARKEAAGYRERLRESETSMQRRDEQLATVMKALGLSGDEKPDPEQLAADLTASRAEAVQSRVELAVFRTAAQHGADPDALLDSRTFLDAVKKLDPTGPDFRELVGQAIEDAVDTNPRLKTPAPATAATAANGQEQVKAKRPAPKPGRSGGDFTAAAPGGKRQWTGDDVKRATPAELATAMDDGLLSDYLAS